MFPRSQSSRLLSSLSSARTWAGEWDLAINPNKCSCLTIGSLPPLSPRQLPTTKFTRSPTSETWGFPLTRLSPRQCTAERLRIQQGHSMVQRSFCGLSKTAFIPLSCTVVRPQLEYAMEANAPTLRADLNQLERVKRLAIRLVRGLCHVPYEERLRQLNSVSPECRRLRADLNLVFKIFKGEVGLNPSDFFLHPPRTGLRGHTYRLLHVPSRLRHRSGAFSVRVVKYWNTLPASLVLSPSVSIFKKQLDRQWPEIFPAAPV